jgi:hypothetical protein
MLSALSGIRRIDGSFVEGPYTSGGTNNTSFLGTKGAALGPNNPIMLPGGGSISQGEYFANYGGSDVGPNINTTPINNVGPNINTTPINNVGIGSLTQNPINTTPINNVGIGSPYLNNNQDLDQYLNSYVENLINRRMRDIFGGIMSIFQ